MPSVAHVIRDYGRLTEPFIRHRVTADTGLFRSEIWTEIVRMDPPAPTVIAKMRYSRSGSRGDRAFHTYPPIGHWLANDYAVLERERRPDLIHAHYIPSGYLAGMVTSSPLVVSAYGWDLSILPTKRVWQKAIKRLADRADRLLVEGPHMRETAISLGWAPEQVSIVRISAGFDEIQFESPQTTPGPVRLLCPGRMVEKKGHQYAIRAFAAVADQLRPGSVLVMLGDGRLEPMLRQLARELRVSDRVLFVGSMERAEYLSQQASADLMLAPSTTGPDGDSEGGAPTTILDAHASGTITIGSRHADIPFLIEDGVTGYLFEEREPHELAEQIVRAVHDQPRWPEMARRARDRVIELHSDQAIGSRLEAVYSEVLP